MEGLSREGESDRSYSTEFQMEAWQNGRHTYFEYLVCVLALVPGAFMIALSRNLYIISASIIPSYR